MDIHPTILRHIILLFRLDSRNSIFPPTIRSLMKVLIWATNYFMILLSQVIIRWPVRVAIILIIHLPIAEKDFQKGSLELKVRAIPCRLLISDSNKDFFGTDAQFLWKTRS